MTVDQLPPDPDKYDDPRSELPKLVVAQVTLKQPAGPYSLDDVRARLRQQLGEARAFDRFIDELRRRTFVDVRLDDLAAR